MKKVILSIIALGFLASCSQNLDQNPTDDFSTEDLSKVDPAELAAPMLSNAVLRMHTMGSGTDGMSYKCLNLAMDLMGNDMCMPISGHSGWFNSDYAMDMETIRGKDASRANNYWTLFYKNIFQANQAMEFLPADPATADDPESVKFIYAQAKTYRAFNYFHLISVYQDAYLHGGKDKAGIPYYTKTDAPAAGRGNAKDVYDSIMVDVTEAIALFKESGMSASSKEAVSIYVAYMLQARVALAMGEYSTAISAATQVINAFSLMSKDQALNNGFQEMTNPEVIWGYDWILSTSISNYNFAAHANTTCENGYGGDGCGWKIIDERLYNQISDTDWRKELFYAEPTVVPFPDGDVTVAALANKKFNAPDYNQDEIYMRAAEAYFIKAEAEAKSSGDAAQTLYNIVSTRDASYTKSTKTGAALVEEIILHKRIELWGEGFEYYENKRLNKGVDRTSSQNHYNQKVVAAGKYFTFQIPRKELSLNPNIQESDNNPD